MKERRTKIGTMLLVTGLLIVGLIVQNGCKKSGPASPQTSAETMQEMHGHEGHEHEEHEGHEGHEGHEHEGHEGHEHMAMKTEPAKEIVSAAEQTTCPIMGGAIDKAVFVEYQGKKVYFCCPGCEGKFEAEPEKYVVKLPQFKQ
jgi:YHS domain-containing protein